MKKYAGINRVYIYIAITFVLIAWGIIAGGSSSERSWDKIVEAVLLLLACFEIGRLGKKA